METTSDEDGVVVPRERLAGLEHDLAEVTEVLRSISDGHPDGVFRLDVEGRFLSVNPAAERLSGYSEDELLGRSFADLLPDAAALTRTAEVFGHLLAREPQEFAVRFLEKAGTIAELEIVGLPVIVDDEVVGIYGIAKNVTERRRLARAIDDARDAAEKSNQAKSLFLANISHEIRTPLSSVLAAAEMLGDSELDDVQRRLVSVMDRSGARLLRLINQVLDFSRIEAGATEVVSVTMSVASIVDDVLATAAPAAKAKDLDLLTSMSDGVPATVLGDPMLVAQVLENLLGNAVKFTDDGRVRLDVDVLDPGASAPEPRPVRIRFTVTDTGIGLSADVQRTMFDPFSQADASITREYGGTGLGLAIVRGLVTELGGALVVDSDPGRGSTFAVVLPFALLG